MSHPSARNPAVSYVNGWSHEDLETTAALLAALAHPLRLAIVRLLTDGERSATDICDALWSSQPNISRHLGVLQSRRVLLSRKEASSVYYSLRDPKISAQLALIGKTGQAGMRKCFS